MNRSPSTEVNENKGSFTNNVGHKSWKEIQPMACLISSLTLNFASYMRDAFDMLLHLYP